MTFQRRLPFDVAGVQVINEQEKEEEAVLASFFKTERRRGHKYVRKL
jgi:hypothetical protein